MKKGLVSDFKKRASEQLDNLKSEKAIILIGPRQKKFAVMPIQHYHSLVETLHLLSTHENANRLSSSIRQHKDSTDGNQHAKKTKKSLSQDSSDSRILKLNKNDSEFLMNTLLNSPEPSERLKSKLLSYKSERNTK